MGEDRDIQIQCFHPYIDQASLICLSLKSLFLNWIAWTYPWVWGIAMWVFGICLVNYIINRLPPWMCVTGESSEVGWVIVSGQTWTLFLGPGQVANLLWESKGEETDPTPRNRVAPHLPAGVWAFGLNRCKRRCPHLQRNDELGMKWRLFFTYRGGNAIDLYISMWVCTGFFLGCAHTQKGSNYICWKENQRAYEFVGVVNHTRVRSLHHVIMLAVKPPNIVMETNAKK